MSHVKIGQKVPNFVLPSSEGGNFTLDEHRGKNIVIYFYPRDMTPTCTTQACDFRDYHSAFNELNAVVVGVSADELNKHHKFIGKYNLPFLLLSDINHEVSEMFGVWKLKKNFGKEYYGIERSTFLIDEKGKLRHEWRKVKVKDHVSDVIKNLQFPRK